MQNELIGELGNEFGPLPEFSEEKSLEELGAVLSSTFSGAIGKQTGTAISKLVSSKMPAGFNMAAMKGYMKSKWGLGSGRQFGVLLIAITSEPPARFDNDDSAKAFLDSIISRYGAHTDVKLTTTASGTGSDILAPVAIDAAMLDAVKQDQTKYFKHQLELLANYLKIDLGSASQANEILRQSQDAARRELDLWNLEHGEKYAAGIKPVFDAAKARHYNSWWNWARQDVVSVFNEIRAGDIDIDSIELAERCVRIANRSDKTLLDLIKHMAGDGFGKQLHPDGSAQFADQLMLACQSTIHKLPTFRYTYVPKGPKTIIRANGKVEYSEIPRENRPSAGSYVNLIRHGVKLPSSKERLPFVHLRRVCEGEWRYDREDTTSFLDTLQIGSEIGLSFSGKVVLITGAGIGSIGTEIVRGLLEGGARVILTSSRAPSVTASAYQSMYAEYGSRGSELTIVQFNQGSAQDCEALINYIYDNLKIDLDAVIPFAAIPEGGRELDGLDSVSELAHRLMLVNTLRLLGNIKKQKHRRRIYTRPTQVILPLSPNHGTFGGDGLYSESKVALETLLNRWYSESWSNYLLVCGAVIGWTRGTGLMSVNNIVAEAIETHDVVTFSQTEMAFNILALMAPQMVMRCQERPIYADLNGCLHLVPNLKELLSGARSKINEESTIRKALVKENELSIKALYDVANKRALSVPGESERRPRANLLVDFPSLPEYNYELESLSLKGMVDLTRVVVVVGFSELGPWGNARTRWEMEAYGKFSREGYVEITWIMGLIKHFDGMVKDTQYTGWVDSKSGEPVHDDDIQSKYGEQIQEHTGIRLIEPEVCYGYDPEKKEFLHEVAIEEDLEPFEASKATADAFKLRHGDKVIVEGSGDTYNVRLKRGATLLIPKAVTFNRLVAGQIPSGWDPKRYGIPEDIVQLVDPITLYTLCALSEALLSAGITDPHEIYRYIHPSMLGNCIGSGAGGAQALRGMYRDRWMDLSVQKDVLQETFINTVGAWVNMLVLGSTGPIKSPVGACATSIESLDIGCETIITGKADMCFVGGTDDFNEELSQEFANMEATSNSHDEFSKGRTPTEMSRPTASTRAGFMESQGAGVQIIASAELALKMGLPIYGIVASTALASDKIGRSVPAPGQGILTNAREVSSLYPSPLLDINYRRSQIEHATNELHNWHNMQLQMLEKMQKDYMYRSGGPDEEEYQSQVQAIQKATERGLRDIRYAWGNDFARDNPEIAPLRAALAVWNLTVDDIEVVSLHGTSTKANDTNESDILQKQMRHLRRKKGNPVLAVAQKYLTGHPKGGAGAWMLNGALQMMNTGIIPGNRNADNVDIALRKFDTIIYPNKTLKNLSKMIKAFSVTSFGFGQKGGQVIGVHPRYLYATLERETYRDYCQTVTARHDRASAKWISGLMTNSILEVKSNPIHAKDETAVFLDPNARVTWDEKTQSLRFNPEKKTPQPSKRVIPLPTLPARAFSTVSQTPGFSTPPSAATTVPTTGACTPIEPTDVHKMLTTLLSSTSDLSDSNISVGVDVEDIDSAPFTNPTFIERNFTPAEQAYARAAPSAQASFAGRWSAKEAVFKSLGVQSRGAGEGLREIEIENMSGEGQGTWPPGVKVSRFLHCFD